MKCGHIHVYQIIGNNLRTRTKPKVTINVYMYTGDAVNYTHWYPGRKDSLFHGIEDCVTMRVGRHDGRWEDERCGHHYAYICEFGISSF